MTNGQDRSSYSDSYFLPSYFNAWHVRIAFRTYTSTLPNPSTDEHMVAKPGLVSGGGSSSSRSWESLTSSIQRRSKSRSAGSGAEPRAETESQEHPESTNSCRPRRKVRKQMMELHPVPAFVVPCPIPPTPHPTSRLTTNEPYLAVGSEAT